MSIIGITNLYELLKYHPKKLYKINDTYIYMSDNNDIVIGNINVIDQFILQQDQLQLYQLLSKQDLLTDEEIFKLNYISLRNKNHPSWNFSRILHINIFQSNVYKIIKRHLQLLTHINHPTIIPNNTTPPIIPPPERTLVQRETEQHKSEENIKPPKLSSRYKKHDGKNFSESTTDSPNPPQLIFDSNISLHPNGLNLSHFLDRHIPNLIPKKQSNISNLVNSSTHDQLDVITSILNNKT